MIPNLCTHALSRDRQSPQAILIAVWSLSVVLMLATIPAKAQGGTSNHAQASLHIQVNVVPAAFAPKPQQDTDTRAAVVVFDVPANGPRMSVTEELHELSPSAAMALKAGGAGAVLKTLTVVLP
jgi:hypothetical protein